MSTALVCLAAVLIDRLLGEPRRGHPLVAFGRLAARVEADLRRLGPPSGGALRWLGACSVALLTVPAALLAGGLSAIAGLADLDWAVQVGILYLTLGGRSLAEHALRVHEALCRGCIELARRRVGWMVSRETGSLDERRVCAATVESVLENGCDAVFAALFWFVVGGVPAAVGYRLVNTLDAMWGYRNERYRDFGWAAARLDDAMNWVPARLTALSYLLAGDRRRAWRCWQEQSHRWESPNAGPVMAAGAGALGVVLGGPAHYHGERKDRPRLGEGRAPAPADIPRAIGLMRRALALWMIVLLCGGWWFA